MRILKQKPADNKRINVLLSCIRFNDDVGWDFPLTEKLTEKWRKFYGGPKTRIKVWFVDFYDRFTLKGATMNKKRIFFSSTPRKCIFRTISLENKLNEFSPARTKFFT
jgi:hypothetical protein